ncbi:MAG: trimethylamine methyltransferase family protein, partial [Pseudomonadota bacterium]
WDDFDEALAAVRDIGPGGHYLGHAHTIENFQRAFFMPKLFDNNSYEQWSAEGELDTTARAITKVRQLLEAYEEPQLDAGIDEALRDYIARREREIPAADALNNTH